MEWRLNAASKGKTICCLAIIVTTVIKMMIGKIENISMANG